MAEPFRRTIALSDPRALRAVAHPLRLELIGLLRREGPLTATAAGDELGESAANCSFHLRQLAKYGLVEEAGGGRGRERPWRATALFTEWENVASTPEASAALEQLNLVVADRYFEEVRRWHGTKELEPRAWQEAAFSGDMLLYATPEELAEVGRELAAVTERFVERVARPELRPSGSRPVSLIQLAIPSGSPKA